MVKIAVPNCILVISSLKKILYKTTEAGFSAVHPNVFQPYSRLEKFIHLIIIIIITIINSPV